MTFSTILEVLVELYFRIFYGPRCGLHTISTQVVDFFRRVDPHGGLSYIWCQLNPLFCLHFSILVF